MLMRTLTRWATPKRQLPPGFIKPCQPILARTVPAGDGWLHELKHDGYRVIAFQDGDRVRLWSRNGRDWSAEFVAITEALRALPFRRVMIDGEAVSHCLDGTPESQSRSAYELRRGGYIRAMLPDSNRIVADSCHTAR